MCKCCGVISTRFVCHSFVVSLRGLEAIGDQGRSVEQIDTGERGTTRGAEPNPTFLRTTAANQEALSARFSHANPTALQVPWVRSRSIIWMSEIYLLEPRVLE